VTAVAGLLMVSRFYYSSFKGFKLTGRVQFTYAILIPLVFVVISLNPPVVLLALFGTFALSAPCVAAWRKLRRRPAVGAGKP
jgi:CDP-diacylglycerol--serine O-phosphatidyltransferase